MAIDNPNGRSSLCGFSWPLSDVTEDNDGFSFTLVDVIIGKGAMLVRRSRTGLIAGFSPTVAVITRELCRVQSDVLFKPKV